MDFSIEIKNPNYLYKPYFSKVVHIKIKKKEYIPMFYEFQNSYLISSACALTINPECIKKLNTIYNIISKMLF